MKRLNFTFIIIMACVLAYIGTQVSNEYYIGVATLLLIHAVNATALNILLGYTGIISIGQAAFFGLGAYVAAVLSTNYGVNPLLTMPIAAAAAFAVAYLVGSPILKLHGNYLAMATLGMGMILYIFMNEMDFITGGPSGFVGIGDIIIGKFDLADEKSFFVFMSIFFMVFLFICELFDKSFLHNKLKFIKNSESACRSYGITPAKTKVMVFASMAALTAFNGAIFTFYTHFISPVSFSFKYSVELLAMATIGGLGYITGGVVGAVLLGLVPELFSAFEEYEMIIYGGLLAVVIMFLPGGISGTLKRLVKRNA
ncbi:branched-chain amino acid ABC transporter permease [Seleniivibrio sp.]|uniref:branched-chain amino acid ABC transporter permease n=1 Tax=Seleniivibrio sp. TaxID=2898801 RepID=UPI0025CD0C73|nr:branched-chain amino acid ABC transporter permease [Seleniivibrio sp.]MCD8554889.1 branched-chain amino acid ABC transporter permease [Seleniivibrio sp.]